MKKLLILLMICQTLLPLIAVTSNPVYTSSEVKPMVFVCSLCPEKTALMIGNSDKEIFYTQELSALETTPLVPLNDSGSFNLYMWDADLQDWALMYRAVTEEDYSVTLRDGKVLGLLITPENYVEDFELSYDYTGYAKVMCANLTSESMAMVEFARQFGDRDAFWVQGLPYYSLSSFGDVGSGSYSAFWQDYDQAEKDEYFYTNGPDGNPQQVEVEWGKWYMMMLHAQGESSTCEFIDITPDTSIFKELPKEQ